MVAYLTPKKYREMGLGVDLTGKTDAELTALLAAGSEMVNRYCAAPRDHDFKGGTVTDEKHRWLPGNVYRHGTVRVYPFHKPIKSVSGLRIDVTNTQYINLTGSELYANEVENWIEPVSLAMTTAGVFGFSILPNVGLRQPVAKLSYTYGWMFDVADEELTSYSGNILASQNQFWLTEEEVALKADGVTLTANVDYSVDYTEGLVTVSSYDPSAVYEASYTHPLPQAIPMATALITNDLVGQSAIAAAGMLGLSGIKVEEVELRQSSKINFYVTPVNSAAAALLDAYVYRSIG